MQEARHKVYYYMIPFMGHSGMGETTDGNQTSDRQGGGVYYKGTQGNF